MFAAPSNSSDASIIIAVTLLSVGCNFKRRCNINLSNCSSAILDVKRRSESIAALILSDRFGIEIAIWEATGL